MEHKLTEQDGRDALHQHAVAKAAEARTRYGPTINWPTMQRMLDDREVVRYPTKIRFDADPLEPGEFAYAQQTGPSPADGFCIFIHPAFQDRPDALPLLVAYHLVRVNYGDVVTHEQAEAFGATLLGLDVEDYYQTLCRLADGLNSQPGAPTPT